MFTSSRRNTRIIYTVAIISMQTTLLVRSDRHFYNVAYGRPVTIEPPEATCGVKQESLLYESTYKYYCTVDTQTCAEGRQYPRQFTRHNITPPSDVLEIGHVNCSDAAFTVIGSYWCNVITFFSMTETGHSGFTSMMWIRPTSPNGNIMNINGLLIDLVYNQLCLRDLFNPSVNTTSSDWQIPLGTWTHLALQIYNAQPYDPLTNVTYRRYYIFINGTLTEPGFVTTQIIDLTPSLPSIDVYVGAPSVNNVPYLSATDTTCQYLYISRCNQAGYGSLVMVNITEDQATRLLELGKTLDNITNCSNGDTALWRRLVMYACSVYYPPCVPDSTWPILPCQSLCSECNTQCGATVLNQYADCSALPTNNCIDENYLPLYKQYVGEVRDFHYTEGILTNREIKQQVTGIFDTVSGNSACLCTEGYPAEAPDSLSCCIDNGALLFFKSSLADYPNIKPDFLVGFHGSSRYSDVKNISLGLYYTLTLPSYITDSNSFTFWATDMNTSDFSVTISFNGSKQVNSVALNFAYLPYQYDHSMLNGYVGVSIVKSLGLRLMHYWSNNCTLYLNMAATDDVADVDVVRCSEPWDTTTPLYSYWYVKWSNSYYTNDTSEIYLLTGEGIRLDFHNMSTPVAISSIHVYAQDIDSLSSTYTCYLPGTVTACSDLQTSDPASCCQCLSYLDPNLAGPRCEPYITSFIPPYGPEAGGTDIFIFGQLFGANVSQTVTFESTQFVVLDSNDTYIHCKSSPGIAGDSALLNVGMATGFSLYLPTVFQYRPNPIILTISPRTTFISGGIDQTVKGMYLDSVFVPIMTITVVYNGSTLDTFASDCAVLNGTVMTCPSPAMNSLQLPPAPGRSEPQDSRYLDGVYADLKFYIGFKLDGYDKYEDLSKVLPDQQTFGVSYDPVIEQFTEPDMLRWYNNPAEGDYISILGQRLNYATDMSEYTVTIGKGVCVVVDLQEGQIVCQPPLQKPELGIISVQGQPQVQVKVGNLNPVVGYLGYSDSQLNMILALALGIGLGVIVIATVVLVIYCKCCRHHSKDPEAGNDLGLTSHYVVPAETRAILQNHIIDRQRLDIGEEIGRGHFGKVFKGYLYKDDDPHRQGDKTKVAIKTIRDTARSSVDEFLDEAIKMKDFAHPNVLMLCGVVVDNGSDLPLIVLPYMDNGDLKSFVANDTNGKLSNTRLTELCLDVARGMQYLGSFSYVHRDLAARNCMVDEGGVVKVADFGMAKDVYESNYYKISDQHGPQPVRWMAVESLEDNQFSAKSDVWSFGVLMWEVMTRGKTPYWGIENFDIKRYVVMGRRLEHPHGASEFSYQLMLKCWSMDAEDRPTFSECVTYLQAYLTDKTFTLPSNTDQQASFSNMNGQAGDYVRLRASNKNGDKSSYLQMQDGDEHVMMNGYVLPTGAEYEHRDDRNRNETLTYQNLQDVANNTNDSSNRGSGRDPNGRRLNAYETTPRASGVHHDDQHVYQPASAFSRDSNMMF